MRLVFTFFGFLVTASFALTQMVTQASWLLGMAAVGAVIFVLSKLYRRTKHSAEHKELDDQQGKAKFAGLADLRHEGLVGGEGIVLGKHGKHLVRQNEPLHVVMFSATGGGKTQAVVMPSVLLMPHRHKIVVDPKGGEVERTTANYLRMQGNEVSAIRLDDPLHSVKYNPLQAIRNADFYTFEQEVAALAQLILPDAVDEKENHFRQMGQAVIGATIAYHVLQRPEATLPQMLRLLTTQTPDALGEYMELWRKETRSDVVASGLNAYKMASDREQGSFTTTLSRFTRPFLTEVAKEIFSNDGLTWRDLILSDTWQTCFIQYPIHRADLYAPLARLMIGQATEAVMEVHHETGGQPLAKAVTIIADEAASLGYCQPFERAVNYLRGANANLLAIYQSPDQVRRNYREANSYLSGFDTWLIGKVEKDAKFAEEVSKIIGDTTIEQVNVGYSSGGTSKTTVRQARPIVKTEDIRMLGKDQLLAISGSTVSKLDKAFWSNMPKLKAKVEQAEHQATTTATTDNALIADKREQLRTIRAIDL